MNVQELIESGTLELYVAGALSDKEARTITAMIKQHDILKKEVKEIEIVIMYLLQKTANTLLPALKHKVERVVFLQ